MHSSHNKQFSRHAQTVSLLFRLPLDINYVNFKSGMGKGGVVGWGFVHPDLYLLSDFITAAALSQNAMVASSKVSQS